MSFYSTWEGQVQFESTADLERFLRLLRDGGRLNESYSPLYRELIVEFPECISDNDGNRNVHNAIDVLCDEFKWDGYLIGFSNDGCFEGYFAVNGRGVDESYDLDEWFEKNFPKEHLEAKERIDLDLEDIESEVNDFSESLAQASLKYKKQMGID